MRFSEVFGQAEWIGAPEGTGYFAVRDRFEARAGESAEVTILGFGRFILFVNGVRAHEELFLPINAHFENVERKGVPKDEVMTARAYPCRFDISNLLHEGINTLTVLLGGGWYTGSATYAGATQGGFGRPKVCYRIQVGEREYVSSVKARYSPYFVERSEYNAGEIYDFSACGMEIVEETYDDSAWENVVLERPLDTEYFFTDCPADKLIDVIRPTCLGEDVYDAGLNLTGYPVLISGGGDIEVIVSEILDDKGQPEELHRQRQYLGFKNTKPGQRLMPLFTWLGFRYFKVVGNAEVESVHKVYADVAVNSSFESDNETLNWLYNTFVHTMLSNMHEGQPSDCPHIERRGYTGDGQLTCAAVFRTLDAKAFYRKWIDDISDCQDRKSGHVQNTAPYTNSGGGPGGWGIAIVKVPYEFMKYYGDEEPARRMYGQMLHYLEFMESRSQFGLVTKTMPETAWCLGDWCPPGATVKIAPPFVNTYFYIKAMEMMIEMAERFGHEEDIPMLRERIEYRKSVLKAAYCNPHDGHFFGGEQGADAFALDIGIGTPKTAESFINRYENQPTYDGGIFGTDLITKQLFALGRGDIAFKLLTAEEPHGYGKWRKMGVTSLWEYWTLPSRSMSHPMFGSPVTYLFDDILGIKQDEGSIGYSSVTVKPADIPGLDRVSGSITTPHGVISVSYERTADGLDVKVEAPEGVTVHR